MSTSKRTWLIRLKELHELSDEDMGQILGISRAGYNKIQNGTRGLRGKFNSDNHLKTLSEFFDVSVDILAEMEDSYKKSLTDM